MEQAKKMNNEERDNVLFVLNDFAETFRTEAKARKEIREKIDKVLEVKAASDDNSNEQSLFEKGIATQLELNKIRLDDIFNMMKKSIFPVREVSNLREEIASHRKVLQDPHPTTVLHHHHVTKSIIAAIVLATFVIFLCFGWYHTHQKLAGFIASDTKYRFIKLDADGNNTKLFLYKLDSIAKANPKFRDSVLNIEKFNQQKVERLLEVQNLREKIKELERNVK